MNTRLTLDLQSPKLMTLLRFEAVREGNENQALLKLAEPVFGEWDNPKDSDYDRI